MGSSHRTPLAAPVRSKNTRQTAVWGITGSIGMGKTTVARQFAQEGVPLFCSDEAVHLILAHDETAKAAIKAHFAKAVVKGEIQRPLLGKLVFQKPEKLALLESILHPAVRRAQEAFIVKAQRARKPLVLLDIPLLYETGAEQRLDGVIVVTASARMQRQRVMRRQGMTQEKLDAILARQWRDSWKRVKADAVIHTGGGMGYSKRQVKQLLKRLLAERDVDA